VVAARRPLTVEELNVAVDIYSHPEGARDEADKPMPVDDFRAWISNYGGFLVQVIEESVQFIHQTVKEFLVGENSFVNIADTQPGTVL
jgi:hypothetical protein